MRENDATFRGQVAARLRADADRPRPPAMVGFDGFVDHIISAVDQRTGPKEFSEIPTIADFGARISAAAGQSTNIEFVVRQVKLGGNGPIMAHALRRFAHPLTYVGTVGEGQIHPAFAEMADGAEEVISLGDPGITDAVEFSDGKVMLGKLEPLEAVNLARLRERVGDDRLAALFEHAGCVATVNWTMLLELTEIWRHLHEEVLPRLERPPLWFVDLADPAKRPREDLREALRVLARMQDRAPMVLGLNGAEAQQVGEVLGVSRGDGDDEDPELAREACVGIRDELGLHRVVCHLVRSAAVAGPDRSAAIRGFFDPDPQITTGAGDHFNAGYLSALVDGLDHEEALLVGTATSGYYVSRARTPDRNDLTDFIEGWEGG